MMGKCKACGRPCRKTSIARVSTDEGWVTGRICVECRSRALVVVATKTAPELARQPLVIEAAATLRDIRRRLRQFEAVAQQAYEIETARIGHDSEGARCALAHVEGQSQGLYQAIALCDAALEGRL